jgi:dolichol-phosphate mannosyltransferase
MIRLALDGITNFSYLPLQLATYFGFVVAGLSLVGILAAVALRLFSGHALTGQATTLVSVLFLGGIQLIFLGIIGEYLGRIYDEVRARPLYIVREVLGEPAEEDGHAVRATDARTQGRPTADSGSLPEGPRRATPESAPSASGRP